MQQVVVIFSRGVEVVSASYSKHPLNGMTNIVVRFHSDDECFQDSGQVDHAFLADANDLDGK